MITAADVVTIVDARVLATEGNRRFLEQAMATGPLSEDALRGCKALVVTSRGIYTSPISPQGLARRLGGFSSANG